METSELEDSIGTSELDDSDEISVSSKNSEELLLHATNSKTRPVSRNLIMNHFWFLLKIQFFLQKDFICRLQTKKMLRFGAISYTSLHRSAHFGRVNAIVLTMLYVGNEWALQSVLDFKFRLDDASLPHDFVHFAVHDFAFAHGM